MKTRRIAIVSALLAIVLSAALIVGATFALFSQSSSNTIDISVGDLKATATFNLARAYSLDDETVDSATDESGVTRVDFTSGGRAALTANSLELAQIAPGDGVVIALTIANLQTSSMSIKYRVQEPPALEAPFEMTISSDAAGQNEVALGDWSQEALAVNTSATIYIKIELPAEATNEAIGKTGKVEFKIDIVQGNATEEDLAAFDE